MPDHTLDPIPENIAWGYLEAARPPVLRVASGEAPRSFDSMRNP